MCRVVCASTKEEENKEIFWKGNHYWRRWSFGRLPLIKDDAAPGRSPATTLQCISSSPSSYVNGTRTYAITCQVAGRAGGGATVGRLLAAIVVANGISVSWCGNYPFSPKRLGSF